MVKLLAISRNITKNFVIAKGGKGGRGNMALATGNNPTPNYAEKGDIGNIDDSFRTSSACRYWVYRIS